MYMGNQYGKYANRKCLFSKREQVLFNFRKEEDDQREDEKWIFNLEPWMQTNRGLGAKEEESTHYVSFVILLNVHTHHHTTRSLRIPPHTPSRTGISIMKLMYRSQ